MLTSIDWFTLVTALVTGASLLTNIIPTPGADAPAWQRLGYRVIELLALVGQNAKAHPDAAAAAKTAFEAASRGDLSTAASESAVAAQLLGWSPPTSSGGRLALLLAALLSVPLMTACSGLAALDAKVAAGAERVEAAAQQLNAGIAHACDMVDQAAAAGQSIAPAVIGLVALTGSKAIPATEAAAADLYRSLSAGCAAARANRPAAPQT